MASYNVQMSYFNGTSYDELYPMGNFANMSGSLSSSQIPTINISSGTTGSLSSSRISGLSSGNASVQNGSYSGTGSGEAVINLTANPKLLIILGDGGQYPLSQGNTTYYINGYQFVLYIPGTALYLSNPYSAGNYMSIVQKENILAINSSNQVKTSYVFNLLNYKYYYGAVI